MEINFYRDELGNFGDDLNYFVWEKLIKDFDRISDNVTLIGIGTIFTSKLDSITNDEVIVFGTGVRNPDDLPQRYKEMTIFGVRGPLSAHTLGLSDDHVIGDPAYILPSIYTPQPTNNHKICYMSHLSCENHDLLERVLGDMNIKYLKPQDDYLKTIDAIRAADVVITEAMHGAIIADALRVPFYPVNQYVTAYEGQVNVFKWNDWAQSMNLEIEKFHLSPLWNPNTPLDKLKLEIKASLFKQKIKKILKTKPYLSKNQDLDHIVDKQKSKVDSLNDYLNKFKQS